MKMLVFFCKKLLGYGVQFLIFLYFIPIIEGCVRLFFGIPDLFPGGLMFYAVPDVAYPIWWSRLS